ncbi:MAG: hypothetical protein KAT04_14550 [Methylococcales bacterium]|nr:hypothetical protein [Methylococcales bacterium]
MSWFSFLSGGVVNSIERIASEFIETDMESAEAKSLFIKTLDPNGRMRRDLSKFASRAYGFYLISTTILIFAHAYGLGDKVTPDGIVIVSTASKEAMEAITDLFTPITASWAGIVSASFGVNLSNTIKGK